MIWGVIEKLIGPVFGVIDQAVEDKDERNRLKQEIRLALMNRKADLEKYARDVIVAEAEGESWLQRSWRPITMLVFVAIVANNYIFAPYLGAFGGVEVYLDLPERIWDLLTIGIGGYIVGRSGEKAIRSYSEGRVREAEARRGSDETDL